MKSKKQLMIAAVLGSLFSVALFAKDEASLPKEFRKWTHTKSMVIPDKSHGLYGFHHIYANPSALHTLKAGGTYADGAEFVVSFYEVVNEGGMITAGAKMQDLIMKKHKADKETGGWIFAAFDPSGKPKKIDVVKDCLQCHLGGAKGSDFVFSKYVD